MTWEGTPRVWRVFTKRPDASDQTITGASARGWDVTTARCTRLPSGKGRVARVLGRNDAAKLYEDMHRRPVAVIYDGKPMVRTHPGHPYRDDRAVTLFQFVRYKCFTTKIASNGTRRWESGFEEWLQQVTCDGRTDPRILPFYIFVMKSPYDLGLSRDRQRFRQSYKRKDGALKDDRKRRWSPPRSGAGHGKQPQTVRGLRLDNGFHWDVTTRQSQFVTSVNTIWRVPRYAYVNIYPDGYIRAGRGSQQRGATRKAHRPTRMRGRSSSPHKE